MVQRIFVSDCSFNMYAAVAEILSDGKMSKMTSTERTT